MRGYWGTLLGFALLVSAGCSAKLDERHARSQREWQALCRAMQSTAPALTSGQTLEPSTLQQLQQVGREADRYVVWIYTATPANDFDRKTNAPTSDLKLTRPTVSLGGGTGLLIEDGRVVLTNEHVIRDASTIMVRLSNGRSYSVQTCATLPGQDLALLRIEARDSAGLPLRTASVAQGTAVVAVAGAHFPPAARNRVGVITRNTCSLQNQLDPACHRDYAHLLESTAELQPGFSGGPLLDRQGRLVGINVATAGDGARARGYALWLSPEVQRQIRELAHVLLQ